jgi:flagellar assembly factor FliW
MLKASTSNKLKQHISTKMGQLEYTHKDIFLFKNGIYGFENLKEFIITSLPYEDTPKNYKCLQSETEKNLTLIIMNVMVNPNGASIINAVDLETHLLSKNLALKDVAIFLVTSVYNERGKQRVSVNTAAPIILQPSTQEGWQFILDSPAYNVKHYVV